MPPRVAVILALLLAAARPQPPGSVSLEGLLSGATPAVLTLVAPLNELFQKDSGNEEYGVRGTLSYKDPDGRDVALPDVTVSVRGHTSETECSFPKLKLKAKGSGSLKIGTHCGEEPDDALSKKYGRLTNEKSPLREALAYKLLEALEVPALRTRPARITYVDSSASAAAPLVRNAILVEDDADAMKRAGGTTELSMETFGDVRKRSASHDAARIVFGEALIANFDWCLKFSPDDAYRCNEQKPLWNLLAFDRGGGQAALMMKDLDLAGIVVGTHPWFSSIFNPAFVPSKSEVDVEVISQVQRTRSLYSRADLDALRRDFAGRKAAVYAVVDKADVDSRGREIARAHVDAFFGAIADEAFYRPVVATRDVQLYVDAAGTKEACGPKDTVDVGTPVNVLQQSGSMSQVVVLDALWRWGPKNQCAAVEKGSVWIRSDAISSDYPR
ncbi:MAG TPA: hypothetical protein VL225_08985 [Vicinamibacterales bacterium]|jgi:hypothetical protein|nr:hypothetical protein [Vicinamibacterales bacterium]